jgi:hypothetical protein
MTVYKDNSKSRRSFRPLSVQSKLFFAAGGQAAEERHFLRLTQKLTHFHIC